MSKYVQEQLKPGYTGLFVVQLHDATSTHWDLRLEFPVESLKESLTSYTVIREHASEEPKKKVYPDKPGSVLRSWAVPKHRLPGLKPILATETEDHDFNYKDFEGVIPEGQYGAGTVEIYDHGKFEFVDVEYDKKYVVDFKGNKIKGLYALIKTKGKKFLWIKVKHKDKYSFQERILKVASDILGY